MSRYLQFPNAYGSTFELYIVYDVQNANLL